MNNDVRYFVLEKINSATVVEFPFPHIYINGIFPDSFYEEMLGNLPSNKCFAKTNDPQRLALDLNSDLLLNLSASMVEFWSEIGRWIAGAEFCATLQTVFDLPRVSNNEKIKYRSTVSLTRSWYGYDLPPHTDSGQKVLSGLFYLARDDSHRKLGTSIFLPKDRDYECDGTSLRHPFHLFDHVKTLEFFPNTFSAFRRSNQSFHGVYRNTDPTFIRDALCFVVQNNIDYKRRRATPTGASLEYGY